MCIRDRYHDAPEIITGDMPTPVKYSSPTLRDAYKALETESVRCMTGLLPDELSEELSPFISGELLTAEDVYKRQPLYGTGAGARHPL